MSWAADLPKPKSSPLEISVQELASLPGTPGIDYVVVDTRRTDIIGDDKAAHAMLPSAINLPAQTFYQTLPVVGQVLKGIPTVVFHCNKCTPGGRGRRVAGWYQDWLDAQSATGSQALVLNGGWKAWMTAFPDDVVLV